MAGHADESRLGYFEVTADGTHARYRHLHVVVRLDEGMSLENAISVVSAWWTKEQAQSEVERLTALRTTESRYVVFTTRLKGAESS